MEQKHLTYLDVLRESGITNMFGARPYLKNAFPELTDEESRGVMGYWMDNFDVKGTKI
jgi:hypothetical protein